MSTPTVTAEDLRAQASVTSNGITALELRVRALEVECDEFALRLAVAEEKISAAAAKPAAAKKKPAASARARKR